MPFSNPYGLSGFRIKSSNPNHFIKLSMTDGSRFDEIHLEFLRHFRAGTLLVKIDKAKPIEVKTQAFSQYVDIEKITRHGRRVRIAPKGDGPIELLSWTFKRNQTGIIYHSHGIVGATINVIKRWNQEVVFYELKKLLKPSLILVAYGTNEGFHDDLNMRKYTRDFQARLALLRRAAPRASIVVIGPPDANRLPSFCHQRRNRNCSPLTSNERKHYQQLLARRDQRLCRWHPPPKLAAVRDIQRYVANKEGYFFWDWSQIMGGQCGIHTWTNHKLAYKDHIHLTKSGYQRSADALFAVINR
jgi:lysophospholipase L1-like esterase